jgi:hypothetical protein
MVLALVSGSLSARLVYHYYNTHLRLVGRREWIQSPVHQRLRCKRSGTGDGRQVDISVRVGYGGGMQGQCLSLVVRVNIR